MLVGIIIVVALALAVALVVLGLRSSSGRTEARVPEPATSPGPPVGPADDLATFHLEPADFHVDGDTAVVSFDVEAPEGGVDDVMSEMLLKQAIEAVRERRARGLPLEDVSQVRVLCKDGGEYVEAVSAELAEPGSAAFPNSHDPEPKDADDVDPLHRLAERVATTGASTVSVGRADELPVIGSEIRLTAELSTALRDLGVDPAKMSAGQMTRGLLELAGYTLTPGASADSYVARRAGTETYLALVDHETGSYPELSEAAINSFLAGFYASGAAKGLLFSDKFGPHLVYEKERRDARVRFITRERLQAFVDSIAAL